MVLSDLTQLVDLVKSSSPEEGLKMVTNYGNMRAADAIEQSWKYFRKLIARINGHKRMQLKRHVLNFDEDSGAIPLVEFVRYFAAIEDELRAGLEKESDEVRKFAENIHDTMWNRIGNIRIDKRTIFQKN